MEFFKLICLKGNITLTLTSRPGIWNIVKSTSCATFPCKYRSLEVDVEVCLLSLLRLLIFGLDGGKSNIPPEQLRSFFIRVVLKKSYTKYVILHIFSFYTNNKLEFLFLYCK